MTARNGRTAAGTLDPASLPRLPTRWCGMGIPAGHPCHIGCSRHDGVRPHPFLVLAGKCHRDVFPWRRLPAIRPRNVPLVHHVARGDRPDHHDHRPVPLAQRHCREGKNHRVLEDRAAANTITPMVGSTNGITFRADTNPASLPAKLRDLSAFIVTGGGVSFPGWDRTARCRICMCRWSYSCPAGPWIYQSERMTTGPSSPESCSGDEAL